MPRNCQSDSLHQLWKDRCPQLENVEGRLRYLVPGADVLAVLTLAVYRGCWQSCRSKHVQWSEALDAVRALPEVQTDVWPGFVYEIGARDRLPKLIREAVRRAGLGRIRCAADLVPFRPFVLREEVFRCAECDEWRRAGERAPDTEWCPECAAVLQQPTRVLGPAYGPAPDIDKLAEFEDWWEQFCDQHGGEDRVADMPDDQFERLLATALGPRVLDVTTGR